MTDEPTIEPGDLLDLVAYEKARGTIRPAAIAARKLRRVHVGPFVTFGFENLETVRYQIQEMMRAERIVDDAAIRYEIDTYRGLLPTPHELSSTMLIELESEAALRHWLPLLVGIEHAVSLHVGDTAVRAVGEEGRSREDTTASVHYVRFPVSPEIRRAMRDGAPTRIVIAHEHYDHAAALPAELVTALLEDLDELEG